jgi:hypothetical protein
VGTYSNGRRTFSRWRSRRIGQLHCVTRAGKGRPVVLFHPSVREVLLSERLELCTQLCHRYIQNRVLQWKEVKRGKLFWMVVILEERCTGDVREPTVESAGEGRVRRAWACWVAQWVWWLATDWVTGVRSPTEADDFSSTLCAQPALGPTLAPVQRVPGVHSPGAKCGSGVMLTTYPVLVPRLGKRGAVSPFPPGDLHGM